MRRSNRLFARDANRPISNNWNIWDRLGKNVFASKIVVSVNKQQIVKNDLWHDAGLFTKADTQSTPLKMSL